MRKGHEIGKWMPLEIEPFLSDKDVMVWYDDQRWWYVALLLRAWQKVDHPCRLPNDSEQLRIEAGVPEERSAQWLKRSPAVLAKFDVSEDGKWIFQKKQMEVYMSNLRSHRKRKKAGRLGGKRKSSNARAMLQQTSSTPSLSLSKSNSQSRKEEVLPEWIPTDSWEGFIEMRRKLRKPLTERAKRLVILKLEMLRHQGNKPGDVLDQSVANGWQGVFELRKPMVERGTKAELQSLFVQREAKVGAPTKSNGQPEEEGCLCYVRKSDGVKQICPTCVRAGVTA